MSVTKTDKCEGSAVKVLSSVTLHWCEKKTECAAKKKKEIQLAEHKGMTRMSCVGEESGVLRGIAAPPCD